jgi:hypothetical protein
MAEQTARHSTRQSTRRIRRWALLLVALALLAVALVACGLPNANSSLPSAGAAMMSTPVGAAAATPSFSPFTIGAWPSNSMPGEGESVTIYVICRVQDPTMVGPSAPAVGQTVYVRLLDPVNRTFKGTTGSDGIARVPVTYGHARANVPILAEALSGWKGTMYQSQTSFTPTSATASPADGTPTPGETPSATAIATPAESPSATATPAPKPNPTATPAPPPPPPPTPTSAAPTPTVAPTTTLAP